MEEQKEKMEQAAEPQQPAKEPSKQEKKAEKKAEKLLKEKIAALEAEKAKFEERLAAEKNDYLKLMAEFETFRRRNTEEKMNLVATASADTIKGLLPVLDDCERAMAMLAES